MTVPCFSSEVLLCPPRVLLVIKILPHSWARQWEHALRQGRAPPTQNLNLKANDTRSKKEEEREKERKKKNQLELNHSHISSIKRLTSILASESPRVTRFCHSWTLITKPPHPACGLSNAFYRMLSTLSRICFCCLPPKHTSGCAVEGGSVFPLGTQPGWFLFTRL